VEDKNQRTWRLGVGGLWEEIGKLQFNFLVKNGLKPEHFLLDVGCGSLRGGLYFIKYLKNGHYFGIDKNSKFLDGGKIELNEKKLAYKNPILKQLENFEFNTLNQNFDYANAQSVFTHLNGDAIKLCLQSMEKVLVKNGKFFATFFQSIEEHNDEPLVHETVDGKLKTFPNRNPYHYPYSFFENLCQKSGLDVNNIGKWDHPRNQKIMVFTKK